MPVRVLNVAEKPSQARELSRAIGGNACRQEQSSGHAIHVFDTMIQQHQCQMRMTSVRGHLMELDFTAEHRKWNSCAPRALFDAPVQKSVRSDMDGIAQALEREAERADWLVLWLDCDREGENIAFEVIDVCRKAHARRNPRRAELRVLRAHFSTTTRGEVLAALQRLRAPNQHLTDAVDARMEIDLRLGAVFTRYMTLKLQNSFVDLQSKILSYGPCQFPTLGFIVARWRRRQAFVPEQFWSICVEHRQSQTQQQQAQGEGDGERNGRANGRDNGSSTSNGNGNNNGGRDSAGTDKATFSWVRGRLFDRACVTLLYEQCVEGGEATVLHVRPGPTRKQRPRPLNTIELTQRASRYFSMPSDRATNAAEALYQRGILSYPRTETNMFEDKYDLRGLVQAQATHPTWGAFAQELIGNNNGDGNGGKFQWPSDGGSNDGAHPPIHPVKAVTLEELQNEDERNIYELVTRHFLACCAQDALGHQTNVEIALGAAPRSTDSGTHSAAAAASGGAGGGTPSEPNGQQSDLATARAVALAGYCEVFRTHGLMVTERNWLEVYRWERWHGRRIPLYQEGQQFVPTAVDMTMGRTEPPSLIAEDELIKQMDREGIGTDATMSAHIKTVLERGYAERASGSGVADPRGRHLQPTVLGRAMADGFDQMGNVHGNLMQPVLRATMEADCQAVCDGRKQRQLVVQQCMYAMRAVFATFVEKFGDLHSAMRAHFTPLAAAGAQVVVRKLTQCGRCRGGMDLMETRSAAAGGGGAPERVTRFLHCAPCSLELNLPRGAHSALTLAAATGAGGAPPQTCVLCQFQVVQVSAGGGYTGNGYTLCPMCYNNPPAQHNSSADSLTMPCFQCAASCPLAGKTPQRPIARCPDQRCSGTLQLKRWPRDGGFFIGCSAYPRCKRRGPDVPRAAQTVAVSDRAQCSRCASRSGECPFFFKLHFTFKRNSVPPTIPLECDVCIGCDRTGVRDLMLQERAPGGNGSGRLRAVR